VHTTSYLNLIKTYEAVVYQYLLAPEDLKVQCYPVQHKYVVNLSLFRLLCKLYQVQN